MPTSKEALEEKLTKLGEQLHKGWARMYPVKQKHLAAVREAVRREWERTHQQQKAILRKKGDATAAQSAVTERSEKQRQDGSDESQDRDHGRSH